MLRTSPLRTLAVRSASGLRLLSASGRFGTAEKFSGLRVAASIRSGSSGSVMVLDIGDRLHGADKTRELQPSPRRCGSHRVQPPVRSVRLSGGQANQALAAPECVRRARHRLYPKTGTPVRRGLGVGGVDLDVEITFIDPQRNRAMVGCR